jgi:hypothetical protein
MTSLITAARTAPRCKRVLSSRAQSAVAEPPPLSPPVMPGAGPASATSLVTPDRTAPRCTKLLSPRAKSAVVEAPLCSFPVVPTEPVSAQAEARPSTSPPTSARTAPCCMRLLTPNAQSVVAGPPPSPVPLMPAEPALAQAGSPALTPALRTPAPAAEPPPAQAPSGRRFMGSCPRFAISAARSCNLITRLIFRARAIAAFHGASAASLARAGATSAFRPRNTSCGARANRPRASRSPLRGACPTRACHLAY